MPETRDKAVDCGCGRHSCPVCLRRERDEFAALLMGFVGHEDRPCSLDHHGNCQEHSWTIDEPGEVCGVLRARRLLGLEDDGA